MQQRLLHGPVVLLLDLVGHTVLHLVHVFVQRLGPNGGDQVVHGSLYLQVLALQQFGALDGGVTLLLHELLQRQRFAVVWQVHQDHPGYQLDVVLYPVLNDVVDVQDQLLQFDQAVVDVEDLGLDVHGSPGEGHHAWAQPVLEVQQVRTHEFEQSGPDLAFDTLKLIEDLREFSVVFLELVFLQQYDFCGVQHLNVVALHDLGFADELEDARVQIGLDDAFAVVSVFLFVEQR